MLTVEAVHVSCWGWTHPVTIRRNPDFEMKGADQTAGPERFPT